MPKRELGISNQLVIGELMAGINSKEACNSCIYFYDAEGNIMGSCRRYPTYQNRHGTDWCGDFAKIPPNIVFETMMQDMEIQTISEESIEKRKKLIEEAGKTEPKPRGRPKKVQS